jgi:hypothetical protein
MKVVVIVYESMFGNTTAIARSIADGLVESSDVQLICVAEEDTRLPGNVDLLVVGGPTHAWSMSRPNTRKSAPGYADKPNSGLVLEPGADTAVGVREWLASQGRLTVSAAAFDTRVKGPWFVTGRASRPIAKALAGQGAHLVAPPESFLVDRKSHLLPGEETRAEAWGRRLGVLRLWPSAPGCAAIVE